MVPDGVAVSTPDMGSIPTQGKYQFFQMSVFIYSFRTTEQQILTFVNNINNNILAWK